MAIVEWESNPSLLFDKYYFNGGSRVGGYANEGYRDFGVPHECTFRHVMALKPESVLELGCGRGYVGKRLEDAGVHYMGLEISRHCWMTRVCDPIKVHDLCKTPWPIRSGDAVAIGDGAGDGVFDLNFSIATLEHVPEERVPEVIREMIHHCRRGFHGIDFGAKDDGFDKTHCTLRPKEWWEAQFREHAPGWPVEIVDKELLEILPPFHPGHVPPEWDLEPYFNGIDTNELKLNIGSFTTMFYQGWTNLDIADLGQFAAQNRYKFLRCDVKTGIPCNTGVVSAISSNHFLEHLDWKGGLDFLRECRRVVKPDGAMRLGVPDVYELARLYVNDVHKADGTFCGGEYGLIDHEGMAAFDELSIEPRAVPTPACRFWDLVFNGHQAGYDWHTLKWQLEQAGWTPYLTDFRKPGADHPVLKQMQKECLDMLPGLTLFVDCLPVVG